MAPDPAAEGVAQVALPVALDTPLSYRVPARLAGRVRPGSRVLVSLGEKAKVGIVVALDRPEEDGGRLKPVLEALDEQPLLDPVLLELTRRVAEHYFTPWGQVLQAALPLQLQVRQVRRLRLLEEGRQVLEHPFANPPPAARRVLQLLAAGEMSEARFKRALPRAREAVLEDMLRRGWIARDEETQIPARGAAREWWALPAAATAPRVREARRRAALDLLRDDGAMRLSDLARRSGASRAVLRELARRGSLQLEQRPVAASEVIGEEPGESPPPTAAQAQAIAEIAPCLGRGAYRAFLLEGVTGSGKTEVYLRLALLSRERGFQTIYLVPEIGLTPLLAERLLSRLGRGMAVLHSGLPEKERRAALQRIRSGEVTLVLGTRSAVFAPLPRLGLIVVDEEQDPSYAQEEAPRYQARDVALVRGSLAGAVVLLGSATPSLETVARVRRGGLQRLSLPGRVRERPLPEVSVVDMRREFRETGSPALLSRELSAGVLDLKDREEQAILLLNRRGYATFVLCRACGETVLCGACSIAMSHHQEEDQLICHYCNRRRKVPRLCPACGSPHLHFGGAGTQRLEEAVRGLDPALRVGRLDRDSGTTGGAARILGRFDRRELDVLVGTQMVAKGHDFPGVTLVGVVSADASLALPDFRAAERTYQLLTQAAGRAGRGSLPGRVIIQAFAPDHPAVLAAARHDPDRFYERELRIREAAGYPPYTAISMARIESTAIEAAQEAAGRVARRLREVAGKGVRILGPAPAPRARLKGSHRFQVLVKGARREVEAVLRQALSGLHGRIGRARVSVEIDPTQLL
ncbi:MAG TPA: primosomal protein N' [Candidatus Polarisedimenticolia bacterium]|nr:primosomal protein N' [Candidatus Polarisedimenticolia bacterium]